MADVWPMWYFVRPPIYELESETETETETETDRAETETETKTGRSETETKTETGILETETKTIKNRSREVSRPRPGLETNITGSCAKSMKTQLHV